MNAPRSNRLTVLTSVFLLCTAAAFAQGGAQIQPGTTVVTTSAAPVFLMPDPKRVPLRTLPAGTTATVDRVQQGWVRITFKDPQFGPRTGWIESQFVKVAAAAPAPSPERPGQTGAKPGTVRSGPGGQPSRSVQPRRPRPTLRVFAGAAMDRMTASESFETITGSSTIPAFGGGAQGADIWRRLFIELAAEYTSSDGERVFVFNNEVYRLGVPLKIKKLPLDVTGGWRVPMGRVAPFAGAGVTFLRYEETSDFAEAEENIRKWHTGLVALAGVEVRVITNLHIRGDVRYRRIQDALGDGGVSAAFDETDLGGTGVSLKVVFGR